MQISLSQDIQTILDWGAKNLVQFNALKTQACNISHKKSTNSNAITLSGQTLQNNDTFNLVGVTFEHDLRWDKHISSIASAASKKLGFLFRAKKYFLIESLHPLCSSDSTKSGILLSRLGCSPAYHSEYS